ncbi:hypothetical protein RMCBS344292_14150 [Rhizopus microsporus]|nr:hypothetical protein RMCBS344292_14150 [Rhizopus microsporus]
MVPSRYTFSLLQLLLTLAQTGNAAVRSQPGAMTSSAASTVDPVSKIFASEEKPLCHNYRTQFADDMRGWQVDDSQQDTYEILDDAIEFKLLPPDDYVRLHDSKNLPYNLFPGRGPTLNSTVYMRYGRMSATLKASSTPGSVTAFILMGDGGDEIDFEWIGGAPNQVQTNYFWGNSKEYTINGGTHVVKGAPVDAAFHKYTINWQPDKIEWLIDDEVVRTKNKVETCDAAGNCKFPSQPARIQFGLWDGSLETGTAQWAHGPIDWSVPHTITAEARDITVDCNPDYNQIVE